MNIHSEKNFNGESYQSSDDNEENKFESTEEFSNAQEFVYEAELRNSYLEDGNLNINDMQEAEAKATSLGSLSDNAFVYEDSYDINTEAGELIKDAELFDSYSEKGYIDAGDMINAEREAVEHGIQEESNILMTGENDLSSGEEFIKDSLLTETYLEEGCFPIEDVYEAESIAMESPDIDYLIDG